MYIVLRLVATADGAESYRTHQIANVIDSYFKIIQNNAHAYRRALLYASLWCAFPVLQLQLVLVI